MTTHDTFPNPTDPHQADTPGSGAEKKPYHKPSWEVETVFEKAALSCAKADIKCSPGPIQS